MSSSPSSQVHLWLRAETKPFEARACLTPKTASHLQSKGFKITVERDANRIFPDSEYSDAGLTLAPSGSWKTAAPEDALIIGLKELDEEEFPLKNSHIQFAHCFKNQSGWKSVIERFRPCNSTLYDLEFLQDPSGRRVAAFGFHAGFAGAAVGALALASMGGKELKDLQPYPFEGELIEDVKNKLQGAEVGQLKALVIGALGRCGKGAVDFFRKIGLKEENIICWDMAETKKGGPFQEILDVDIFVNCIYLSDPIAPFLSPETIAAAGKDRRLKVIVDVSCDTTNPHNPIPVYSVNTTFDKPTVPIEVGEGNPPMLMISIDHLPTLLPREASEAFSKDLLPSLETLPERHTTARVWTDAEKLFKQKLAAAQAS